MPVPTAELSNAAVAPGPAIRVTPVGSPLNPERVAAVVPSKGLLAAGNTNMNCASVAPPVRVKWGR
jgi:hypothetical protein